MRTQGTEIPFESRAPTKEELQNRMKSKLVTISSGWIDRIGWIYRWRWRGSNMIPRDYRRDSEILRATTQRGTRFALLPIRRRYGMNTDCMSIDSGDRNSIWVQGSDKRRAVRSIDQKDWFDEIWNRLYDINWTIIDWMRPISPIVEPEGCSLSAEVRCKDMKVWLPIGGYINQTDWYVDREASEIYKLNF